MLVNNVGIAPWRESFLSTSDEDWNQVLSINFFAMVRCARAAIPHMVEQGRGAIVSIASDVGRAPDPFFVDYAVSKASILSLSKAISVEFGPKGIRSNAVSPGPTRTPLWDRPGGFAESIAAEYGMEKEDAIVHFAKEVRKLPLGKMGQPTDVANAVFFLASDLASQVTGWTTTSTEVCSMSLELQEQSAAPGVPGWEGAWREPIVFISPSRYVQGPGVLRKLPEYAARYGTKAVVATSPGTWRRGR